ncbi:MAG: hypothetical protein JST23_10885 [Bacteroidetes bacterium]|nr:hypothetical protein [Bacteroidota bacterium]
MMQKIVVTLLIAFIVVPAFSQKKVENIYFHLYTDSLKKGQHNYINVDGQLANGRWLPLTTKDITLSCKEAEFDGNELIIPIDFKEEKVTVSATLKANPSLTIEKTIWIKQKPDEEFLPSAKEVMQGNKTKSKRN